MSFAQQLKNLRNALNPNDRTQEGFFHDFAKVRRRDLSELLYHFDRLDNTARTVHEADEICRVSIATSHNEALEEAMKVVREQTPTMPPDGPNSAEHEAVDGALFGVFSGIQALKTPEGDG